MRQFHLEIVTPDGSVFNGMAESVTVKTDTGDLEIMSGHSDYFAALATGRARIFANGAERFASASGGFVSVSKGEVKIAATTFEYADQIDEARAEAAIVKARADLEKASDERMIRMAKAKLARATNRLYVAKLK